MKSDDRVEPKVCLFTSHRYGETFGGVEKFIGSLSKWLRNKRVRTIIVSRRFSLLNMVSITSNNKEIEVPQRIRSRSLPVSYFTYILHKIVYIFFATLAILKMNKKFHFSTIHCQDNFAGLSGIFLKRLLRIRVLGHSHGPLIYNKREASFSRFISKVLDKIVAVSLDGFFVTDSITEQYYSSMGVSDASIFLIPSGIEFPLLEQDNMIKEKGEFKDSKLTDYIVGYIGRLRREKNLQALILAFSKVAHQHSNFKLILVGDGPERIILEKKVAEEKLEEAVQFTGWKSNISDLLSTFDVFILISLFEGSPIALLEAMAAGKAIIASRIKSIESILKENIDAILVDPKDIEEITQAILLLYNNPTLRRRIGLSAKRTVHQYHVDRVYVQILNKYKNV